MKTLLTKKNVLIAGILSSLFFLTSGFQKEIGVCGAVHNNCWDIIDLIWPPLAFAPALLLLSLITYKMRDEIFHSWISFTKWWVPISSFIIFVTPQKIEGDFSVQVQEPLAFLCAGVLFVASLCLICWKHFSLKKKA